MVKITADADWQIFPFITLKMNRMLIISCGSAELRGFCLPVTKSARLVINTIMAPAAMDGSTTGRVKKQSGDA